MLLRCFHLHLYGRSIVLAKQVLYGVEVMLAHIGKAAAVVVPVTAERLVRAVPVVWFVRSRAEPHVIVEHVGHGLGLEIRLAHPEEFPCKAGSARHNNLQRPS